MGVDDGDSCGRNKDGNNDDRCVGVSVTAESTVTPRPSSPYKTSRKIWKKSEFWTKLNKYSESLQMLRNNTIFSPICLLSVLLFSLFDTVLSKFFVAFLSFNVWNTLFNACFVDCTITLTIISRTLYGLLKIKTFSKFWDETIKEVSFFFTEMSSEMVNGFSRPRISRFFVYLLSSPGFWNILFILVS